MTCYNKECRHHNGQNCNVLSSKNLDICRDVMLQQPLKIPKLGSRWRLKNNWETRMIVHYVSGGQNVTYNGRVDTLEQFYDKWEKDND